MAELGLFPLPIVLVPTERIPLHIFEPRYRELIDECVATGDGVRPRARDRRRRRARDRHARVGAAGARGARRRTHEHRRRGRRALPPARADVGPRRSRPASSSPARRRRAGRPRRRRARARALQRARRRRRERRRRAGPATRRSFDFELAARVDFGVDAEAGAARVDLATRAHEALVELLEIALEAVRLEQTLRERAGQNGKVAPLEPDASERQHDDRRATAARVAGRGERRRRAAPRPRSCRRRRGCAAASGRRRSPSPRAGRAPRVEAALAVHVRLVDVHARVVDRLARRRARGRRRSRSPA